MVNDTLFSFVMQGHGTQLQLDLLQEKDDAVRAAAAAVAERLLQESLEAEVTAALGTPYSLRSDVPLPWRCRRCGTCRQCDFRRNGHYKRRLTVVDGTITLRVPLVKCRCGGYVGVRWKTIAYRLRYWFDVQVAAVRQYLAGVSYRLVADAASGQAAANISHLQSWRTLQGVGETAAPASESQRDCPVCVILDEMYVSVKGRPLVFLLAVADDGEVLALRGPTTRTTAEWEAVLEGLTERRISPQHGLVGVTADGDTAIREAVHLVWPRAALQQCVWHIEQRVRDAVMAEHRAEAGRVDRIVAQTRAVFLQEPSDVDALRKAKQAYDIFLAEHGGTAWGEIVRRAFIEGTEYLRTPGLQRTNGEAERTIKELRRRTRPMDGFKSRSGGRNFGVLWQAWHSLRRRLADQRATRVHHRKADLKIRHTHPKLA